MEPNGKNPNQVPNSYGEYVYSISEAQERVIDKISEGSPALAASTIVEYHLTPEFVASPEVQQAIMDQLVYLYSYGFADAASEFITTHLATPEILRQAQLLGTIEAFSQANFDSMELPQHSIPEDILRNPAVQRALQVGLARYKNPNSVMTIRYRKTWERL